MIYSYFHLQSESTVSLILHDAGGKEARFHQAISAVNLRTSESRKSTAVSPSTKILSAQPPSSSRTIYKKRKDIEGDCNICHEELNPKISDITFCQVGCGQNMHERCYRQWSNRQPTCPMCRCAWKEIPQAEVTIDRDLDQDAVDSYFKWLYSMGSMDPKDEIPKRETTKSEDEAIYLDHLRRHSVGLALEDSVYTAAVAHSFIKFWFESFRLSVSKELIRDLYTDQTVLQGSRKLLADVCLPSLSVDWFNEASSLYPIEFIRDLSIALLERAGTIVEMAEVLAKHVPGAVEDDLYDDDEDDDEDDEEEEEEEEDDLYDDDEDDDEEEEEE
ncbi:hypothetical protein P280DRAFT_517419 [Massarina eburnea CBS 473.64]|uniref:RING-type domain-containing protein n=1 Tax=Massarina eburnea CBS 473.64 TaxID=1395130 RepID=A0A6A6S446_9PLEO|nr:hypothetical protein P280DRAFT_517419 [Massarina eburnea CBS 473.64]